MPPPAGGLYGFVEHLAAWLCRVRVLGLAGQNVKAQSYEMLELFVFDTIIKYL